MPKITKKYKQNIVNREYDDIKSNNIYVVYYNNQMKETENVVNTDIKNIVFAADLKDKTYLAIKLNNNSLDNVESIKKIQHQDFNYYYLENKTAMDNLIEAQNKENIYANVIILNDYVNFSKEIEYTNIAIVKNAAISNNQITKGEVILANNTASIKQEAGEKLITVIIEY